MKISFFKVVIKVNLTENLAYIEPFTFEDLASIETANVQIWP